MGWGHGINYEGEEIGYLVEAICAQPGCGAKIDKGLAYCCGDLDGVDGERGCGGYFCGEHLLYGEEWDGQRCESCVERIEAGGPDAAREVEAPA